MIRFPLLFALIAFPATAFAGLHVDTKDARIDHLDAFLVHKDHREHLILRPSVRVSPDAKHMHWVVPVPSPASGASALSRPISRDLDRFISLVRKKPEQAQLQATRVKPPTLARPNADALRIQMFDGTASHDRFSKWMVTHNIPAKTYTPYLKRGWSFVVATADLSKLTLKEGLLTNLPPLWVTFGSPQGVLPLGSLEASGPFSTRLTTALKVPLGQKDLRSARHRGFEVAKGFGVPYFAPEPAPKKKDAGQLVMSQSTFKPSQLPGNVRELFRQFLDWKDSESGSFRVLYRPSQRAPKPGSPYREALTIPSLRSEKTRIQGSDTRVAKLTPPKLPAPSISKPRTTPTPAPPKASPPKASPTKTPPSSASTCAAAPASGAPAPWSLMWVLGLIVLRSRRRGSKIFPSRQTHVHSEGL